MIRLRQIEMPITNDKNEDLKKKIAKILHVDVKDIQKMIIQKESLDARRKPNLKYIYEIDIKVKDEDKVLKKYSSKDIFLAPNEEFTFHISGETKLDYRPIIIGAGPAGLFCAYLLAENGYKPIIYERGEKIEDRVKTVEEFWHTNKLNPNSNVSFGEGGAGTFSDGKLNTLVKSSLDQKKVFEIFVENGAKEEILYQNKPHIGTDELRKIIINIRQKIIKMGGEIHCNSLLTNIFTENNKITSIEINNEEIIKTNVLVLAIGHSARDTFLLLNNYLMMEPKPFAVGIRIQHLQKDINYSQYGADNIALPNASYKLTHQTKDNRGVYTFCMCPGGFVVNASSEEEKLAINGMSNYKRDEINANSAIVVTVKPEDFNNELFGGMHFQEELERKAYQVGEGKIPLTLYKDYKKNQKSTSFGKIKPVMKGNYQLTNINLVFPKFVNDALVEGIEAFGRKISCFNEDDAILAAVESKTSSPIRILRDENGMANISGIFPCGEGAGYAGGITSAATDGIKISKQIAKIYKNFK